MGATAEQVSLVTFYLDHVNIDLEPYVQLYDYSTPAIYESLLDIYMAKVQDFFPILPKRLFRDQCRRYFEAWRQGTYPRLNPKWEAILNLVFAIASKHSDLCGDNYPSHTMYYARARALAWDTATLMQPPDLPQIQVAGLLAFYYLSVGHVSRAWVVVGMALRFSQSLGLHVRNEDPSTTLPRREVLVRIWWSIYYLDRHLSVITGRPSVIVDGSCSVPLPIPFAEGDMSEEMGTPDSSGGSRIDANEGSFIRAIAQMGIITQSILSGLYSAGTMVRSSFAVQQDIIELKRRLENWVQSLPAEFDFRIQRPSLHPYFRERILLGFEYYSSIILLTRPCLGGLGSPAGQETRDESFLGQMATLCVEAAKAELDMLQDKPKPYFVFENGPWWSITHYLMQSLAAILLALSYSSLGAQFDASLSVYAKEIIRWLRSMENDPLAQRAYRVAFTSFEMVANRRSLNITDLWNEHTIAFPGVSLNVEEYSGVGTRSFPTVPAGSGVLDDFDTFPDPMVMTPSELFRVERSAHDSFGS
ncbi:hypothetical protein P280DRAFT_473040 [Massarina eburnea CBS 473.64]|uniref:Xylanolytic transcriptional activator regulatory domain-containing protein n=1 Tax=Massarina eburnea CBS 473.64 TaxID=1395130 RepID=A0A6A6RMH8_9PLEO|nr:hypothetical protein P280DRAFT_473040 [Massarina eburnea CBS 473.64]